MSGQSRLLPSVLCGQNRGLGLQQGRGEAGWGRAGSEVGLTTGEAGSRPKPEKQQHLSPGWVPGEAPSREALSSQLMCTPWTHTLYFQGDKQVTQH